MMKLNKMNNQQESKVLLVDDDKDILALLQYNLEKEGYLVKSINHSAEALDAALDFNPDLIILDIMMPEKNGIEVCRELRAEDRFKETFIFFLSAKSETNLQLAALDNGGDDYIEKLTGLRALNYKIGSVLKQKLIIRKRENLIKIGDITLNRQDHSIHYNNKIKYLAKYEFELLYLFAQNPKMVISKDLLLHNIWGSEMFLLTRSIDNYIDNIKGKVGKSLISKVENKGFKLNVA